MAQKTSDADGGIGQNIRSARAKAGMTRKRLAQESGASERYLAVLEAGQGNPSIDLLDSVARALGLALVELLPLGGERDEAMARAAALLRRMPAAHRETLLASRGALAAADVARARRVALVGLRGAGKTTLGAALAARIGAPFVDMSKEVERAYGGSMGLLLELNGQAALRRYEADVLANICRDMPTAVIAAPGGIVANSALYDALLDATHVIWLQATPDDHMNRVIAQGDLRPMANGRSAMADLKAILAARSTDYGRAHATLDTSIQGFDATLDRLEAIARTLADMQYNA